MPQTEQAAPDVKSYAEMWDGICMIPTPVLETILEIINTNASCSITKDSEVVQKLRDALIQQELLERTDQPYVGCVQIIP
ncbi:MAG: hypothetical protein M0R80_03095 [Proteobacteria bacterium]|nr:hypothetical protein [Pseudomonadota bacterium]